MGVFIFEKSLGHSVFAETVPTNLKVSQINREIPVVW